MVRQAIYKLYQQNRGMILFLVLMLVFRSAFADWNVVPTGSMQPTIVEGDRIWVNKLAYDVKVPLTNLPLYQHQQPQRGDIVVFNSQAAGMRLVKRIVGVPGDQIALDRNVLSINGQQLTYQPVTGEQQNTLPSAIRPHSIDAVEDLLGVQHLIRVDSQASAQGSNLANFRQVNVPEEHYLVLGDNRDNSSDSRVIGFVPRHEIVGKSIGVVMSLDYDNYWLPRKERFFHRF